MRIRGEAYARDSRAPDALYLVGDLSISGLSIEPDQDGELPPWSPGDKFPLDIMCQDAEAHVDAEVLRTSDDEVALKITSSDFDKQQEVFAIMMEMVRKGAKVGEQRRTPRLEVDAPAIWTQGTEFHSAIIIDLSMGGAVLICAVQPDLDSQGAVGLQLQGQACECEVRVSRHTEDGFAVEFLEPSEAFQTVVSHVRVTRRRRLPVID